MKLRDKQFWLYEAVIIICAAISMVVLWANHCCSTYCLV